MTTARILLIEDVPANIQAVSAILREQSYLVNVATSGPQALELLERVRPDCLHGGGRTAGTAAGSPCLDH